MASGWDEVAPGQIGERLSTLNPAEIHAALAYYHLHRREIEAYLEEERAACARREQESPKAA